jgi:hypothetical protein
LKKDILLLELIWWFATAIIVALVLMPIFKAGFTDFPYLIQNGLFIALFITFTRYAFLLRYTFLAYLEKAKIAFVLFTLLIVGIISIQITEFQRFLDENALTDIMASVDADARLPLLAYLKSEFIFFAVAAIVAAIFLSGRLLYSVWRLRNRDKI